jgi:hypothetical protein
MLKVTGLTKTVKGITGADMRTSGISVTRNFSKEIITVEIMSQEITGAEAVAAVETGIITNSTKSALTDQAAPKF